VGEAMTVVIVPKNEKTIDAIWLIISTDDTGEGVCAGPLLGPGTLAPLIAADEERLASIVPWAELIASTTNRTLKLIKFSVREEIMEIKP
jgi:hypothetical protein